MTGGRSCHGRAVLTVQLATAIAALPRPGGRTMLAYPCAQCAGWHLASTAAART